MSLCLGVAEGQKPLGVGVRNGERGGWEAVRAMPGAVQSADTACREGVWLKGPSPLAHSCCSLESSRKNGGGSGDPKCLKLWGGALAGRSKSVKGRGGGAGQSNSYSRNERREVGTELGGTGK